MSKPAKPTKPAQPAPVARPAIPGRGPGGQFVKGNKLGKGGSPFAAKALQLKSAILKASTPKMIEKIARRLVRDAAEGEGDVYKFAMTQYLNRMLGNTAQGVYLSDQQGEAVDPPSLDEAVNVLTRHGLAHLVPPARRAHAKSPERQD